MNNTSSGPDPQRPLWWSHAGDLAPIDEQPTSRLPAQDRLSGIDQLPTTQLPVQGSSQSSLAGLPARKSKPPRKRRPTWVRVLMGVLLGLVLLGAGGAAYGYYYFQTNIQDPLSKFVHPVSPGQNEPGNRQPYNTSNITGRAWNILLMGSDNDGKYTFPSVLTQVMMVVRIDTIKNTVTMLSIPRDSWVFIPQSGGMHKIDQAFFLGSTQKNSFDDGVRLARQTIEQDYGITIDRYAWVGLDGFAKVIDTLGGVDVDITHPLVDDTYPDDVGQNAKNPNAYQRLYLTPGPQHLNGQQALEYVRSRHADLVGDIGRTQRQQQVLEALKKKLNVSSVLNNLTQLLGDLQGKVYTDLSEPEMLSFANYARSLSNGALQRITLGPGNGNENYGNLTDVYDPTVGSNQAVLIPNCETIQPLINQLFGLGDMQSCHVTGPGS